MNNNTANPKKRKSAVLLRMGKYFLRHKLLVALAFFLTIASNLLALLGPYLSGCAINAIDTPTGVVDFDSVFFYCGLMAAFYIVSAAFSYLLSVVMIKLSQKIVRQMRREVFNKLMSLPVGYFDRLQAGDLINRISYDIDTVNASLSNDIIQISTGVITVVGSFISMLVISPLLLCVFVVTIPVSVIFTAKKTKSLQPYFRARSGKLAGLNGYAEEMLSGVKTIRAYGREEKISEHFAEKNTDASDAYYYADYHSCSVGPTVNFINNLSMVLISSAGALLYMAGRVAVGDIGSMIMYSRKFAGPINEFANIITELQSAVAAAERIFNLLDQKTEPADAPDATELTNVSGDVEFRQVNFGYLEGAPVLKKLSFKAEHGQTVAVVGPTGAGKTTLVNLLMRFYDPQSGEIYIDGKDISTYTRESLRGAFTMVLQDTWLFDGTIFENIAYGRPGANLDDVKRVAEAANVADYIESLPDGYFSVVEDGGFNLSKGQKQLMTIARAMLSDARMLILDEATSNVDTRTELKIHDAMLKLMEGRTCFVIAHRLSTIVDADLILVVKNGDVVERGRHEELLAENGFYAEIYRSQFS